MFSVLIVDDERNTCEGLRDCISWHKLGVESVMIAYDGVQGIQLAEQIKPDLIISDIKMPNVDGIQFVEKIRESQPLCQIIFISAYADKEYFKSAISLKVIRYVEKPINLDEITVAIKDALKAIKLGRTLGDNPVCIQDIALSLMKPQAKDTLIIDKIRQNFPQFLEYNQYRCLIIQLNNNNIQENHQNELCDVLIGELKSKFHSVISLIQDEKKVIYYICDNQIYNSQRILKSLSNIVSRINQIYNCEDLVFVSIGKLVSHPKMLCDSYSNALLGMKQFFFTGYGAVISIEFIGDKDFDFDKDNISLLLSALRKNHREAVMSFISSILRKVQQCRYGDPDYLKRMFLKYDMVITEVFLQRLTDEDEKIKFETIFSLLKIIECDTLKEIENYIVNKLNYCYDYLELFQKNRHVSGIIQFIEKNYFKKTLSINQISENINLTSAHMCHIFKNEMGTTINQYITEFRINKAKELLKQRNYKLVEIAERTGFSDVNYFTRTFKKITGVTPTQYKGDYLL